MWCMRTVNTTLYLSLPIPRNQPHELHKRSPGIVTCFPVDNPRIQHAFPHKLVHRKPNHMPRGVQAAMQKAFPNIDVLHALLGAIALKCGLGGRERAQVQYRSLDAAHLVHGERRAARRDGARVGRLAAALGVEDGGGGGEDVCFAGLGGFEEGVEGGWEGGEGLDG